MTYASGRPVAEPFDISLFGGGFMVMDLIALMILGVMICLTGLYRNRGRKDDRLFFSMLVLLMISAFFDAAEYGTGFMLGTRDNVISETLSLISFIFQSAVPALLVLYFGCRYSTDRNWLQKHRVPVYALLGTSCLLLIISYVMFVKKGELGDNVGWGTETLIFFSGIILGLVFDLWILKLLFRHNRRLLPFVLLPFVMVFVFLQPVGVMFYTVILGLVHIDEMNRGFYEEEGGTA